MKKTISVAFVFLWAFTLNAKPLPKYVSLEQDLNQYYHYANGGWDGNWYVGHNSCWIVKLPPVSTRGFVRAFIGAKLGRAKTIKDKNKPWLNVPLESKIFVGISQNGGFTSQDSFMLVESSDIPLEANQKESSVQIESSKWFWTEIPINKISKYYPNYLSVWAGSPDFISSDKSPIIAGANTNGDEINSWLNRSGKGSPPRDGSKSLEIAIKGISPALALKLIPENNEKVLVNLNLQENKNRFIAKFNVEGTNIYKAWLEISYDGFHWAKLSRFIYNAPYSVTLQKNELAKTSFYIRAVAVDTLENIGYSESGKIKR